MKLALRQLTIFHCWNVDERGHCLNGHQKSLKTTRPAFFKFNGHESWMGHVQGQTFLQELGVSFLLDQILTCRLGPLPWAQTPAQDMQNAPERFEMFLFPNVDAN
jgi:hypothetical protein